MLSSEACENISKEDVHRIVATYPECVSATLTELEEYRLKSIPATLQQRKTDGEAYLEKEELLKLVEWKLKHGTFRPTLMKLVSSNDDESVRTTTIAAFESHNNQELKKALDKLVELKGVGPATASLILSSYDLESVPFFSDELFRYLSLETRSDGNVTGWDRKIKYSMKEYISGVYDRLQNLFKRINAVEESGKGVTALDMEKVAYVLGRSNEKIKSLKRKGQAEQVEETSISPPTNCEQLSNTRKRRKA